MKKSKEKTWAQLFREAREAAGMTQPELAQFLGVSIPMISRMENGHTMPKWALYKERIRAFMAGSFKGVQ